MAHRRKYGEAGKEMTENDGVQSKYTVHTDYVP
jgi:hypothetical protein